MTKPEDEKNSDWFSALSGAFLATLAMVIAQWWAGVFSWPYMLIAAAFGFFMGWRYGQRAVTFFKELFWWA